MSTRNLTVRYAIEGFAGAIDSLRQVGQAFDTALAQSQQAAAEAANAAKNAVDRDEIERANQEVARSVTRANQIIQNSYRSLGVTQEASVRQQKEQAVAAFNAIKNSGVASASDIARAQSALDRKLKQLDSSLEVTEEQAEETAEGFTILKGAIAGVISGGILNAIGAVGNGFGNLASNIFRAGTTTENLKAQLKTLEGSAQAAEVAYGKIAQFAKTTPYELVDVTQAYIALANRGIKPTAEMLTQLGDIAASQGKPLQQMVEAILDASTGENERLKEFGIQAEKSGDKVTFTFKGISKTVNATADEISSAVLSFGQLDGVLGGMNERAKTTEGQLSNLTDSLDAIYVKVFNAIKPAIDAVVSATTQIISPLAENDRLFDKLNQQAQEFNQFLKDNPKIVAALGDVLENTILVVSTAIADTAEDILSYLEQNPDAIARAVDSMGILVKGLEKALWLVTKTLEGYRAIAALTAEGGPYQEGARQVAEDKGVSRADFDQRVRDKIDAQPWWKPANRDAVVEEVLEEVLNEASRPVYGPPSPKPLPVPTPPKTSGTLTAAPPPTTPKVTSAEETSAAKPLTSSQQFAQKTIAIAKELKIDPQALMTIMLFESAGTLSPKIQGPQVPNQGRGRGLIQFMPATARGLGTSDAALAAMTQLEQLDWVKKYFAQFKGNFGAGKLENLYAAVLAGNPQAVNASDGYTTAREGAVRMMREHGSKAASLLGSVPQGEDISTQYEFDTELAEREEERKKQEEELKQEKRRQEEERRQAKLERQDQQQELDKSALERKNADTIRQFDLESQTLPPEQAEVREVLRSEKEKELALSEKLLVIEQQISNLQTEREYKLADIKEGIPVTNRDLTAEIQELEAQKQFEIKAVEDEKKIGRNEFVDKTNSSDDLESSKELEFQIGSLYRSELDTALAEIDEKYQNYLQSIDDAISNLKTFIENKKLLGLDTKAEEDAYLRLLEQKGLIPEYKDREEFELKRDYRLETERTGIEYDASIDEGKAQFLDRIGFSFVANKLRKDSAIKSENNRYQKELVELEKQYKGQPELLEEFKAKAKELNQVNLKAINQQFKDLKTSIEDAGIAAVQGFFQNVALNFFDGKAEQDRAYMEERLRYAEELVSLENQYKEDPGHLAHLKNRARELNEQKLDKIKNEFNVFNRVINLAGQALLEFTKQLAAMAAQYAAAKFISGIFGSALGGIGGGATAFVASQGITVEDSNPLPNYAQGGSIKSRIVPAYFTSILARRNPGIARAFRAEGEGAQLGVFHTGEELLSRKTGEAGRYQALKARYGFNPLSKINDLRPSGNENSLIVNRYSLPNYSQGGTIPDVNSSILSGFNSSRPRIDLSGLSEGRSQKSEVRRTVNVHTTVVTPNADSFRLNQDQMNQDLVERMRRGI